MATLIEREIHHDHTTDNGDSSAMTLIVTIIALVLIVGFALFFFRMLPFNTGTANDSGGSININLPSGETPAPGGTTY